MIAPAQFPLPPMRVGISTSIKRVVLNTQAHFGSGVRPGIAHSVSSSDKETTFCRESLCTASTSSMKLSVFSPISPP